MRVTEINKKESVIGNVHRNAERLRDLQTDISSGRRINRISDDPIGATVMQDVITNVSRSEQILANIDDNVSWLEQNEIELQHITDALAEVRRLVLSQAGSSSTEETRMTTAKEVASLRQSLFDTANTRVGKLYMFSGTKTLTQPLQYNEPIQEALVATDGITQKDTAKLLDVVQFKATFEGFSSNTYRVRVSQPGIFGMAQYQVSDDDGTTWSDPSVLLPSVDIANPEGQEDDKITLNFSDDQGLLGELLGNSELGIDASEAGLVFPEGIEFVFLPNPPIGYKGNNQKKEFLLGGGVRVPLNITAEELFLKTGNESKSINVFDVLTVIEKALLENDGDVLSERIEEIREASDQVFRRMSDVGNTILRLQTGKDKLEEQIFSQQKRLSEVRDLDMAEAAIDLNAAEAENEMSLGVGGRLLQPSLLDFLR